MVQQMKLWVFGDSNSLPFNLEHSGQGWPALLAQRLDADLQLNAWPAVDNFFIYQSIRNHWHEISPNDHVVVGWSHTSRKMFRYDKENPRHENAKNYAIYYEDSGRSYVRSRGPSTDTLEKYRNLSPRDSGVEFFDTWFRDYYNEYEHQINLQSYVDSVNIRLPQTVNFFFSRASTAGMDLGDPNPLCMLDFVLDNRYYISEQDCHSNAQGHREWADLLYQRISNS